MRGASKLMTVWEMMDPVEAPAAITTELLLQLLQSASRKGNAYISPRRTFAMLPARSCKVIGFRKRPSETPSGPGLKTTYACGELGRPSSAASNFVCIIPSALQYCYKYPTRLLTQRRLCDFFLTSFLSLPAQELLWPPETKPSPNNDYTKGPS